MSDVIQNIGVLIRKAAFADSSLFAMQYAQAALSATQAYVTLQEETRMAAASRAGTAQPPNTEIEARGVVEEGC